jgi:hypothetical protein
MDGTQKQEQKRRSAVVECCLWGFLGWFLGTLRRSFVGVFGWIDLLSTFVDCEVEDEEDEPSETLLRPFFVAVFPPFLDVEEESLSSFRFFFSAVSVCPAAAAAGGLLNDINNNQHYFLSS